MKLTPPQRERLEDLRQEILDYLPTADQIETLNKWQVKQQFDSLDWVKTCVDKYGDILLEASGKNQ
jgi:hypothetical protein